MAQQNEGWPLGLQPLNGRRIGNNFGSMSFNTLLTGSPSSTNPSSDLDTESTGSFFLDKSTTLGSLMGVNGIVELSRRSIREAKSEIFKSKKDHNKYFNFSSCLLCSRNKDHEVDNQKKNPPSLCQFLAIERRATNGINRRNHQSNHVFCHDDELNEINNAESNSLLSIRQSVETKRESIVLEQHKNGFGSIGELFSCMFGQNI
ncbi:hypothetical protein QL285_084009 [Trifolium repens]|nr:hypothetical protein QL285_084009 [Trifolium repens]